MFVWEKERERMRYNYVWKIIPSLKMLRKKIVIICYRPEVTTLCAREIFFVIRRCSKHSPFLFIECLENYDEEWQILEKLTTANIEQARKIYGNIYKKRREDGKKMCRQVNNKDCETFRQWDSFDPVVFGSWIFSISSGSSTTLICIRKHLFSPFYLIK